MRRWQNDDQRKAVMARYYTGGVTTKKFKNLYELPEPMDETLRHRKKIKKQKKPKGWFERKEEVVTKKGIERKSPRHRLVALRKANEGAINRPMKVSESAISVPIISTPVIETVVKFAKPIVPIIGKLAGVDDPVIVAKAGLNSFEDSLKVYKETRNIDDAVISGVKSFVKNYILDKAESYIANDFSLLKDDSGKESALVGADDSTYETALKGTILMTSLYAVMEIIE